MNLGLTYQYWQCYEFYKQCKRENISLISDLNFSLLARGHSLSMLETNSFSIFTLQFR